MKTSEVRIGNMVLISTGDPLVKVPSHPEMVKGISIWGELIFKGKGNDESGYKVPVTHCEGIPLNEEWLERFGFHISWDTECHFRAILGNFELCCRDSRKCYNFITMNNWHGTNKLELEVRYVHQLQNLYFILNGSELQMKEPH